MAGIPVSRIGVFANIGARFSGMTRVMTLGLALQTLSPMLAGCDNKFSSVTYNFTPEQKRAFGNDYPLVMPVVLDNARLKSLDLTIGQLKGGDGWKLLSERMYGANYSELLQELNGHAPNPMALGNQVRGFACGIESKYCAPVVMLRARSMKESAPQKPVLPDLPNPANSTAPKNPTPGTSGSAAVDKKDTRISASSISPSAGRIGTSARVTIRLKGDIKEKGAVDLTASDASGIDVVSVNWKDSSSITADLNLNYGVAGAWGLAVSVNGASAGSVTFSVLPEADAGQ